MQDSKAIGQAYYQVMADKNLQGVATFLDDNFLFSAPLAIIVGKEDFLARVAEFFACCSILTIRSVFCQDDQAVVVFDLEYPEPIGLVQAVALLQIHDGLICRIKLFYNVRLFEKNKRNCYGLYHFVYCNEC